MRTQQDQDYNKVFNELSALILSLVRSPPLQEFSSNENFPGNQQRIFGKLPEMTPGNFAALLMGVSMALMFCGSVTFFIGFMLMPWVLGLVFVFFVIGVFSSVSIIGRSILCCMVKTRKEGPVSNRLPSLVNWLMKMANDI